MVSLLPRHFRARHRCSHRRRHHIHIHSSCTLGARGSTLPSPQSQPAPGAQALSLPAAASYSHPRARPPPRGAQCAQKCPAQPHKKPSHPTSRLAPLSFAALRGTSGPASCCCAAGPAYTTGNIHHKRLASCTPGGRGSALPSRPPSPAPSARCGLTSQSQKARPTHTPRAP